MTRCTARIAVVALAGLSVVSLALATQTRQPTDEGSEERYRRAAALAATALADLEAANFGRAEENLEQLAALMPDNVLPWVNLAIARFRLDRQQDALEALDRATAIAPDNTQALYTRARILGAELERTGAADRQLLEEWDRTVRRLALLAPRDPRPSWLRARLLMTQRSWQAAEAALEGAYERGRDNLVVLVDRLVVAASAADLDRTSDALDGIEDRLNGFEATLAPHADRLRDLVFEGDGEALRPAALVLENLLRPTALYQVGRAELEGREGGAFFFPQLEWQPPLPKSIQGGQDIDLAWQPMPVPSMAPIVDIERHRPVNPGDGADRLWLLGAGAATLVRLGAEPTLEQQLPATDSGRVLSYDVDQDGLDDLLLVAGGTISLRRGQPDGYASRDVLWRAAEPITSVEPVEVDLDGDLDLLAMTDDRLVYLQNNGGGGWSVETEALGLPPSPAPAGAASADFDTDGDLDLLLVYADRSPRLLLNRRTGPMADATDRYDLTAAGPATAVTVADLDTDGRPDVALWGAGEPLRLLLARGESFELSALAAEDGEALPVSAVAAADADNDGDLDLIVANGARLTLWRRVRDEGRWRPEPIADLDGGALELLSADLDADGDLDLVARSADALTALRNEGGNRNQWLRIALLGLNANNAKNNTQGLLATVEVRSAGHYQVALGNGALNHFGLGSHRQAEVVRVVWTNGLAQTWQQVAARQVLVEKQVLKGSCPFLYVWNGRDFEFATDLMWRSTLGMRFADGEPAPHQSARDWVYVDGGRLTPAGDTLWLQLTAELWETIYVDRQQLIALDHPTRIQVVVDESFRPPPFPRSAPLFTFDRLEPPVAARDQTGRDVLPEIRDRDGVRVDGLPLTRYQGVTEGHFLELEFATPPGRKRSLHLILWGWIFPTDTTINQALAQDPTIDATPPVLQVRLTDGSWRTLERPVGLPLGKRKAVVVDLSDLDRAPGPAPASPLAVRIATSMQIYWDAAALGLGASSSASPTKRMRTTPLAPTSADLHFRGYSALEPRRRSEPHLFDYADVTAKRPFPPMIGRYTRTGDVLELVLHEDDRLAVMAPGDELTLTYDVERLPPLPAGWTRDWVLYTDGWVKDADLHTAESRTVEPLPFHAMSSYPDATTQRPRSDEHRKYLEAYQTRFLDDRPFREALRAGPQPLQER